MKSFVSFAPSGAFVRSLAGALLGLGAGTALAAVHPMAPLDEDEIIAAASVLLAAGAARVA